MNKNLHQAQSHEVLRSWQSQRNDVNHHQDFVLPMFIGNDDDLIEPIESMPNVFRYGVNQAIEYLDPLVNQFGLGAVLLFPVMTKSSQLLFRQTRTLDDDGDADDDDGSDQDMISSSDSSVSRFSSQTSYSSDEGSRQGPDGKEGSNAMTTRLLPDPDVKTSMQNPFYGYDLDAELEPNFVPPKANISAQPPITPSLPPRRPDFNRGFVKASTSQDVKLIRGMALKDKHNPVLRLIPKLRAKFPKLLIICDVCLCAFTSTGHCCLFDDHTAINNCSLSKNSNMGSNLNQFPISNKVTCQYLAMLSVEYALRGCNVVAPSDMMDGRIQTIREKLDERRLNHVSILSYSAKFASAFYGPFRQATDNAPQFGDRRAYQLPPGSRGLALKAVKRDLSQGADFVMVKPAGPYIDIVRDIKENHPDVPIAVYQVSGEYSMLRFAAQRGILDLKLALNELLASYRRAGATIIISYFTPEILRGELTNSVA